MARDHTRINLDIWGDDDWTDLPVDAQLLYLTLYTSPGRSYCGAHEWHVGKICQKAGDWTPERVIAAAEVLSERLFLIIDDTTGECLLRSWIKHDGLWRTPNMAVTVANARAELASKKLRGVVVYEVRKLKRANPESTSWERDVVKDMLKQKAIDPAELEPFKGGLNPPPNPGPKGGSKGGSNPYGENGVNPGSNPAPTTATTTATSTKGGYVSPVGHLGPRPTCDLHPHENATHVACRKCEARRKYDEALEEYPNMVRRERRRLIDACPDCDDFGRLDDLSPCSKHPLLKDPIEMPVWEGEQHA